MIINSKPTLPKSVFDVKVAPELLAQAVRVYLANQRKASAKTKTRGLVNKTTAKMFKQKGTGNARHGSYSAPIFVGGGVAFGPTGTQNYARKMSKPMGRLALLGAFSARNKDKTVFVIDKATEATGKTSEAAKLWKEMGLKTALVLTTVAQKAAGRAWKNIEGVTISQIGRVSTYDILSKPNLIITTEALDELAKTTK